jgi:LmbE family N-acetylglucosaminyl deacetylase
MKKIIFGVFAHPDDEAFMVAGTLLKETQAGAELHLLCLTDGAAGTNPDNLPNLGDVRLKEWRAAGRLLGATGMHHLGFGDGKLNNTDMLQVAAKIETIVHDSIQAHREPIAVEFIAFDLNGLTGHIDHIVATRAAALAFYRLKSSDSRMDRLRLACLPLELYPHMDNGWVYMEPGRSPSEIDEIVDARTLRSQILAAIQVHYTQRQDGETVIRTFGDQLGMNYFIVKN